MREPLRASPLELDEVPDCPAVFLLWPSEGKPYLARTALLRRRLRRLLSEKNGSSRFLNLRGVAERIEYWRTGSQIESSLTFLELAQRHFPEDWQRMTRLRAPAFVRLTLENPFPRTLVTTRLSRGLQYGPFATRAAAENFNNEVLDLFQVRRCEENLQPSPQHAGCIYGEMNRCLRPCQSAVSLEEYRGEAGRLEQFLTSGGASLREPAEKARDHASSSMDFEGAERLHQRVARIAAVQASSGELPRPLDQLAGVAVVPSWRHDAIQLWFLIGGCWQPPQLLWLTEIAGAGQSMDRRLRETIAAMAPEGPPNLDHLAILTRWHTSNWRDGEWIEMEWPAKIPYRKLVNAIARVANQATARDA